MSRLSRMIPILVLVAGAAACTRLISSRSGLPRGSVSGGGEYRSHVVGRQFNYSVRSGDTLLGIGAKFAVSPQALAARNELPKKGKLAPNQILRVDNRHIVPRVMENGILINIPQRLLFHFENGTVAGWYPVAIGRPDWQTPTGSYAVRTKEKDPVWDVPVSIQHEMRRKGERVRKKVPPGPDNPLGEYWLGLSLSCCGIHSTIAPDSIYTFQTHGCIRLRPEDAAELFSRVGVGTPVEIIYEPVLVGRDADGAIVLEVHPDVYRRIGSHRERANELADSLGLTEARESPLWEETLQRAEGVAVRLRG